VRTPINLTGASYAGEAGAGEVAGTAKEKGPPRQAALKPSAPIRFTRTVPGRLDGWERTQPRATTTSKKLLDLHQGHFLFELRHREFALLGRLCGLHVVTSGNFAPDCADICCNRHAKRAERFGPDLTDCKWAG